MSLSNITTAKKTTEQGMNLVAIKALVPVWDGDAPSSILSQAGEYTCGSEADCDIVVAMNGVADRHCSIYNHNGITTVVPVPGHPVWLNETAIATPQRLQAGDSLAIGPATFRVEQRHEFEPQTPAAKTTRHSESNELVDKIRRLEARVAEAESGTGLHAPSPLFEARFVDQTGVRPVGSRRHRELQGREEELNRRSEMLQQQLAMFKERKQRHESQVALESDRFTSAQATFEEERARLLDDLKEEAKCQQMEIQAQTDAIAARESSLEQQQLQLEEARLILEAERSEIESLEEQRQQTTQKTRDELNAQRATVARELERLNQSIGELAQHHEDAKAAALRAQTREHELAGFQEELQHQHRLFEAKSEQLAEREAAFEQTREALESDVREITESRQSEKEDLENQRQQLAEQAELLNQTDETLRKRAAELDATAASLQSQSDSISEQLAALDAAAEQNDVLEENRRTLEDEDARLKKLGRALSERHKQLNAMSSELKARADKAAQQSDEALRKATTQAKLNQEAFREAQSALEGRDQQIVSLKAQVADQATAAKTSEQLDVREAELLERENAIAEMEIRQQEAQQQFEEAEQLFADAHVEQQRADQELIVREQYDVDRRKQELTCWSAELQQRHDETAHRVSETKRLYRELRQEQQKSTKAADEQDKEFDEARLQLVTLSEERDSLKAERDEFSVALDELKSAFEIARDELAKKSEQPEPQDEKTTQELESARQEIEAQTADLVEARQALTEAESCNDELRAQLVKIAERVEQQEQKFAQATNTGSEDEAALLQEVEELRSELATVASSAASTEDFASQIAQYEQTILELRQQLETANENSSSAQLPIVAELKARLEDQQRTIEELSAQSAQSAQANDESPEDMKRMHRELDERTNVLDERESSIRERQRMLEQSEAQIEVQRREMLDARQKLELARAEIQLAMETPPDAQMEPEIPEQPVPVERVAAEPEPEAEEATPAVRSEIAELFGLTNTVQNAEPEPEPMPVPDQQPIPETIQSDLPAVDDYSQEESAAVSMKFEQNQSVLLSPEPEAEESSAEGDGDDFVASYMEQLLARNRENAGGSLPDELKENASPPEAPAPAEKATPSGQKSFIDSYMSGQYDSQPVESLSENRPIDSEAEKQTTPRAKIDLAALRNDMNSFRELSTKSVENALASHAKRQEKGGLTTRAAIFVGSAVTTILITVAAMLNVIPFGPIVWLAVVATAVSGGELFFKISRLRKKVQETTTSIDPPVKPGIPAAADESLPTKVASDIGVDSGKPIPPAALAAFAAPGPPAEEISTTEAPAGKPDASDEEEDQYFEL